MTLSNNIRRIIFLSVLFVSATISAAAVTRTVTNTNDSGAGSLRAQIAAALSGDTINFNLTNCPCTITLTSGVISFSKSLTITGPGASQLTLSGNGASQILSVSGNAIGQALTVSGLTFANGSTSGAGGAFYFGGLTLSLSDSVFTGSTSGSLGGGLFVGDGAATIDRCEFRGNTAVNGGGFGMQSGPSTIRDTRVTGNSSTSTAAGALLLGDNYTFDGVTISGNTTTNSIGGLYVGSSTLTMARSTISNNRANTLSGLYALDATLTVTDSTISSNVNSNGDTIGLLTQATGPRVANFTNVTISQNTNLGGGGTSVQAQGGASPLTVGFTNSTISGNSYADNTKAAGLFVNTANGATVTLKNTIVSGNTAGGTASDVGGNLNSASSFNLIGIGGGLTNGVNGNIVNVTDPKLAPLGDYGGPTETMRPIAGSPVIDKGAVVAGLAVDQRQKPRLLDNPLVPNAAGGNGSDIGAVEVSQSTVTTLVDGNPGSLRSAIEGAAEVIDFSVGACPCTVPLNRGEFVITRDVEIDGPGANLLRIEEQSTARMFSINAAVALRLRGVTISGTDGRGGLFSGQGGAILNNGGELSVYDSVIQSSTAQFFGGALNNNVGTATFVNSTISGNTAANGGAIFNSATLRLINSTVSGNTASGASDTSFGGAIVNGGTGTTTITNSTITANSAPNLAANASGILSRGSNPVTVKSSIIAGNSNGLDVTGTFSSSGFNLVGNRGTVVGFSHPADLVGSAASPINPRLAPLNNYGGSVPTHNLQSGSPAIDKGGSALVINALAPDLPEGFSSLLEAQAPAVAFVTVTTDQRGFSRVFDNPNVANAAGGDGSDIGAVEQQVPTAAGAFVEGRVMASGTRGLRGATVLLTRPDGSTASAVTGRSGEFRFDGVETGGVFVITVASKRYQFQPRIIDVSDGVGGIVLTPYQ